MCEPKYGKVSSHRDLLLLAQLATRREAETEGDRACIEKTTCIAYPVSCAIVIVCN